MTAANINDLRRAFYGGDEQALLQSYYDAGLSFADLLASIDTSVITASLATGVITQTFATADATHAARTSAATAVTAATDVTPFGYTTQAQADAIVTNLNAVRADLADTAALLNFVIDGLQAAGHFAV